MSVLLDARERRTYGTREHDKAEKTETQPLPTTRIWSEKNEREQHSQNALQQGCTNAPRRPKGPLHLCQFRRR